MVVITVEAYQNSRVHTVTVKNKDYCWIKVKDVQNGLGVKNIRDLLRKEMWGIFGKKDLTKEEIKEHIRSENEITKNPTDNYLRKYVKNGIIEKIIKNCRGV